MLGQIPRVPAVQTLFTAPQHVVDFGGRHGEMRDRGALGAVRRHDENGPDHGFADRARGNPGPEEQLASEPVGGSGLLLGRCVVPQQDGKHSHRADQQDIGPVRTSPGKSTMDIGVPSVPAFHGEPREHLPLPPGKPRICLELLFRQSPQPLAAVIR